MKVFDGFRLSASSALSSSEVALAKKFALDTRLEAEARGLFQFRKYTELPNGGYMYSIKAGDFVSVHVVPPRRSRLPIDVYNIPDWGSGWVVDGTVTQIEVDGQMVDHADVVPTTATVARLNDFTVGGYQPSARYGAVAPAPELDDGGATQYENLRPSFYSGRMRELVQYLLGYGKPPNQPRTAFARAMQQVAQATGSRPPSDAAAAAAFESGVQVHHDYRFYRTHGLTQASLDGSWWVVEISTRGVLVMPLQYFRGTTNGGFKAIASAIDAEVATVLGQFNGFPTGESFTDDPDLFDCYKRAGIYRELVTAAAASTFYDLTPSSSVCGWCFNQSGTEAQNVAFGTTAGGVCVGERWRATFSVTGAITPPNALDSPMVTAAMTKVGAGVPPFPNIADEYKAAVVSKLRYLQPQELMTAAAMGEQAAFDYVDALQVERWTATGTLTAIEQNVWKYVTDTDNPGLGAEFKIHEPLVGSLVGVDTVNMFTGTSVAAVSNPPAGTIIDAPYYVYFVGNTLKQVRFYWDPGAYYWSWDPFKEGTWPLAAESCIGDYKITMDASHWRREQYGIRQPRTRVYTTDVDERHLWVTGAPASGVGIDRLITEAGTYAGPTITVEIDYDSFWHPQFPAHFNVAKAHYYALHRITEVWKRRESTTHVVVPDGDRNGVLTCVIYKDAGYDKYESVIAVGQPNVYWRYAGWQINTSVWPQYQIDNMVNNHGAPTCAIDSPTVKIGDLIETVPGGAQSECKAYSNADWLASWASTCDTATAVAANVDESSQPEIHETGKTLYTVYACFDRLNNGAPLTIASGDSRVPGTYLDPIKWQRSSLNINDGFQTCKVTSNSFGTGTVFVGDSGPAGWGPGIEEGTPIDTYIQQQRVCFVGVVNADGV